MGYPIIKGGVLTLLQNFGGLSHIPIGTQVIVINNTAKEIPIERCDKTMLCRHGAVQIKCLDTTGNEYTSSGRYVCRFGPPNNIKVKTKKVKVPKLKEDIEL